MIGAHGAPYENGIATLLLAMARACHCEEAKADAETHPETHLAMQNRNATGESSANPEPVARMQRSGICGTCHAGSWIPLALHPG